MSRGRVPRNDGKRVCYKCKAEKELSGGFHKDSCFALGYSKVCKECYKISNKLKNRIKKIKTDIDTHLIRRCATIKHRAKTGEIPYNLTPSYLRQIYDLQNGKCYYTGRLMRLDCSPNNVFESLSVDRLTPSKGYVEGNVVLCTQVINAMKNYRTEEEFKEYLKEKVEEFTQYLSRG